jgi:hypothetical protein
MFTIISLGLLQSFAIALIACADDQRYRPSSSRRDARESARRERRARRTQTFIAIGRCFGG